MFLAIVVIGLGAAVIGSALAGVSLADYLGGNFEKLNPKGGRGGSAPGGGADIPAGTGAQPASGADPKDEFKGPHAATLRLVDDNARKNFGLHRTQLCRPANASYGATNSLHKLCRAGDYAGPADDMMAFAQWAKPIMDRIGGELFYDPAGWTAPGFEHKSHVHAGA